MAEEWDTPDRVERAEEVADFVRRKLSLSGKLALADVGSGTGVFGLCFADLASRLSFIDTSVGMLEELSRKLEESGIGGASVLNHDISSGPPAGKDEAYDLVVSLMAFHHIEDYHAALASIYRMLRKGGYACIIDLDREDGSFHGGPEGIPHLGFDREELGSAAGQAGFGEVEFDTPYVIRKETDKGLRDFPLFLLAARR